MYPHGILMDPVPVFRFGTNIILFALTQGDSITNQVMDPAGYGLCCWS